MIHFLLPGITRAYSDFPVKAGTDQNQDYCHKLVIRLHRVGGEPVSTVSGGRFESPGVFSQLVRSPAQVRLFLRCSSDDPALHPEALQEGRGEAAAQEVRAHPEVSAVRTAEEHVRGHPHPDRVSHSPDRIPAPSLSVSLSFSVSLSLSLSLCLCLCLSLCLSLCVCLSLPPLSATP